MSATASIAADSASLNASQALRRPLDDAGQPLGMTTNACCSGRFGRSDLSIFAKA